MNERMKKTRPIVRNTNLLINYIFYVYILCAMLATCAGYFEYDWIFDYESNQRMTHTHILCLFLTKNVINFRNIFEFKTKNFQNQSFIFIFTSSIWQNSLNQMKSLNALMLHIFEFHVIFELLHSMHNMHTHIFRMNGEHCLPIDYTCTSNQHNSIATKIL